MGGLPSIVWFLQGVSCIAWVTEQLQAASLRLGSKAEGQSFTRFAVKVGEELGPSVAANVVHGFHA